MTAGHGLQAFGDCLPAVVWQRNVLAASMPSVRTEGLPRHKRGRGLLLLLLLPLLLLLLLLLRHTCLCSEPGTRVKSALAYSPPRCSPPMSSATLPSPDPSSQGPRVAPLHPSKLRATSTCLARSALG